MRKLSGKRKPSWLVAGLVSGTTVVTTLATTIATTVIPNMALASGFSLSEQSARSLGQAFSGRASDADAATTVADNPAGMSRLTRPEFSGGFALVDAHTDISHNSGSTSTPFGTNPINGSNDGDMIPLTPIPFGFYVHPIDDRLALGFGIFAPFGLTTDYETDFQGRYFGTESSIQVITAQPTLSYKIGNGFSVGFGLQYNRFDGELKRDIFNALPGASDIHGGVKGDDWAWGYNIGLLYELDENTRFGLTYNSKVDYTLEGRTKLENVPVGPAFFPESTVRYDASLDITTPERIDFSFTHGLTDALTLHGDVAQTNWSRLQEIRVDNQNAPATVATTVEPLDWERTMFYSLGLSYKIDPQWTVRGGIAFDEQPIPDSTRSVRLPAGDRKMAAIGASWAATEDISIDFSYLYIKEKEVRVEQEGETLGVSGSYTYDAKFDSHVNLIAAQLNWKF